MSDELTKESLYLMLRMKHDAVKRRGKPRLGQVLPDGQVDLLIDIMPSPSKTWWQCLTECTEGTVMEGRVTTGGNAVITVQSTEDELEADVRRTEELMIAANLRYDKKFDDAQKKLDAMKNALEEENIQERKRRLEDRLKNF